MAIKPELIELLREKRERIKNNVPSPKLEALHAKGALSARERIECLFDEGTFQEMGMHAEHHAVHFGMAGRELPADGVITGSGYIGDVHVAAFCQDYSVLAGTLGKMQARKISRVMRYALKIGTPVIASDIGPNRELTLGQCLYFDSRSELALSARISEVVARVAAAQPAALDRCPPFDAQALQVMRNASALQLLGTLRGAVE